jgi:hypothetical protein
MRKHNLKKNIDYRLFYGLIIVMSLFLTIIVYDACGIGPSCNESPCDRFDYDCHGVWGCIRCLVCDCVYCDTSGSTPVCLEKYPVDCKECTSEGTGCDSHCTGLKVCGGRPGETCCPPNGGCCKASLCQECTGGECKVCGGRPYEECANGECCKGLDCMRVDPETNTCKSICPAGWYCCGDGHCAPKGKECCGRYGWCDPAQCQTCVGGQCVTCDGNQKKCCYNGVCKQCCKNATTGNCEAHNSDCGCDPIGWTDCTAAVKEWTIGQTRYCWSECGGTPCYNDVVNVNCYAWQACTDGYNHIDSVCVDPPHGCAFTLYGFCQDCWSTGSAHVEKQLDCQCS